jgi:hypothetical protein
MKASVISLMMSLRRMIGGLHFELYGNDMVVQSRTQLTDRW